VDKSTVNENDQLREAAETTNTFGGEAVDLKVSS